jgi:hypothetical protein
MCPFYLCQDSNEFSHILIIKNANILNYYSLNIYIINLLKYKFTYINKKYIRNNGGI